ncbi:MAG: hypothetical protein JST39_23140 [Bacteroidetes bacterium]|nr:hypothetical protein [Bacteroidota bacterium]
MKKTALLALVVLLASAGSFAQLGSVEFGKNRLQFKKFKWQYFQTENFNSYYYENGLPLGKYVAQLAEKELPDIEGFLEYGLQRRANIVIYNSFNDMEQSNIGLSLDWQTTGGITKLVNNKVIVYYTSDHENLRRQIRSGIARILLDNILFGDDLGEFAANQALLDLPKWLTDGYVDYAAENWSTDLDDQLKSAILSGNYRNFYQFAFEQPLLAGHSFWQYIAERYKKENVTYFLYLARVYRNLNNASNRIAKKKFKAVLADFMQYEQDKYDKDIRARRNQPKGNIQNTENVDAEHKYFHYSPNPAPRSQTYAIGEFIKGKYEVILYENFVNRKVLLKTGIRTNENELNPNYPLLAWDGKGTNLAVIYSKEGKVQLFVYDILQRYKKVKQEMPDFDQIQDMKFMLDKNTLLLSAVRKGQSDIYIYKIDKGTYEQITNDVYDDLDPSFVAFPNKSGIIYASNRPSGWALTGDTILPSDNRYNIFLVDNWNRSEFKQITQLSRLKYGNARFPMQYNSSHFTYVSDENGIGNRWAGFFTTRRAGLDTVYKVGDDILHNPDREELDSTLRAHKVSEPDSMYTFAITKDSSYVFALTNYQSSLKETKIAGDNGLVSEVRQEGDLLMEYKLKVDDNQLKRRNVNPRPTDYRKRTMDAARINANEASQYAPPPAQDTSKKKNLFETGFENEKKDSAAAAAPVTAGPTGAPEKKGPPSVLRGAKQYEYKLKFFVDNVAGVFNNDVLLNRYQPYTGALPMVMNNNGGFNALLKGTVLDVMEDLRFTGAIRLPLINTAGASTVYTPTGGTGFQVSNGSLFDAGGEWYARFDYLKKRFDYSAVYYRQTQIGTLGVSGASLPAKMYTNLYQGIVKYPFDKVRSIRISAGVRIDKTVLRAVPDGANFSITEPDIKQKFLLMHVEYVHDNTINPAMNIYKGLRYKLYFDFNQELAKQGNEGKNGLGAGFDGRYYYPIYRNFIWAAHVGGDFSFADQKILYYLGGADGWMFPKANTGQQPAADQTYAYQALAVNMRGFNQNVANGSNAMVINSEFRLPVFTTFFNKPINNAFLRNFMLTQFFDLGTAFNTFKDIARPFNIYPADNPNAPVVVKIKAGGVGPFVGGYGFGVRSTLLGYFLKLDAGWPMDGFFKGKPIWYFGMGVDF